MELIIILLVLAAIALGLEDIYRRCWSRGLKLNLTFSKKEALVGETVELKEVVANTNRIFMPYIELKYQIRNNGDEYESQQELFSLISRQKVTRTLEFPCEKRGVCEIDQIYVISRGLFLRKMYDFHARSRSRLMIYPRLLDVSQIGLRALVPAGEEKSELRIMEDPFSYRGVKEYGSADTMNRINWNATAQTGRLMANTYEDTRSLAVKLVVQLPDVRVEGAEDLCETSISLAASLFMKLHQEQCPVSMISNGKDAMTGFPVFLAERADHLYEKVILETFSRIDAENLEEGQKLSVSAGTTLVLLAPPESENRSLVQQALEYGVRGGKVLWIVMGKSNADFVKAVEKLRGRYAGIQMEIY